MKKNIRMTFLAVCVLLGLSSGAVDAWALKAIPSLGEGAYEVLVFSDYFCPPCKRIDSKAEPLFKELLATGKVKITFVDVPFNPATPIYARNYLYAVNAGAGDEKILAIRKALFAAAQEKRITTKEALENYLKEEKIKVKAFDEKPIFLQMNEKIKSAKIEQTPTCIIRQGPAGESRYTGADEIWKGLSELKELVKPSKKSGKGSKK